MGVRLFTGPALRRYFDQLPVEAYAWCKHFYEEHGLRNERELVAALRKRFHLEPVDLKVPMDITVAANAALREDSDGDTTRVFLASARVPYMGSKVFLRTPLASGFRARFPGRIIKTSIHLGASLPSLDVSAFAVEVAREAERIRDAVHAFRLTAFAYDERVLEVVRRVVRTF